MQYYPGLRSATLQDLTCGGVIIRVGNANGSTIFGPILGSWRAVEITHCAITYRLLLILGFAFSWAVTVPMALLQGPPEWMILATFAPIFAALLVNTIATKRFRFWHSPVDWTRLLCGSAVGAALIVVATLS